MVEAERLGEHLHLGQEYTGVARSGHRTVGTYGAAGGDRDRRFARPIVRHDRPDEVQRRVGISRRRHPSLLEVNTALAKLDDGRKVKFLDINATFLEPDGTLPKDVMPDLLHPNEKGYQIWADAMESTLAKMLK